MRLDESVAIEEDLLKATERDSLTILFVNTLVENVRTRARKLFKDIYTQLKCSAEQHGGLHVVFVLDESASLGGAPFHELGRAYHAFIAQHLQKNPAVEGRLSVVMFDDSARTLQPCMVSFESAPPLRWRN
jgi:hypothetical protein